MRKSDLLRFYWTRQEIVQAGDYPLMPLTNAILCVNIGTVLAFINGFPINPPAAPGSNGESWGIGGGFAEIVSERNIEITFAAPAGGRVFMQCKYFVPDQFC